MRSTFRFITLLVVLLKTIPSLSFTDTYAIKKLGMENGLSNNYIFCIAEDPSGFLWFGTEWGLNRFDGKSFKPFMNDPADETTLSDNGINKLLVDKANNKIWIATKRSGLNAFDCSTEKIFRYPIMAEQKNSTYAYGITDLCFDSMGDIWIATYGNGLKKMITGADSIVHYDNLKMDNYIWSVYDDKKGNLYIGHVGGGLSILSLHNNSLRQFPYNADNPYSLPSNTVFKIFIDSKENVWLCTNTGLSLFDPVLGRSYNFKVDDTKAHGLRSNDILSIAEINNVLWIGTANGISTLNLDEFSPSSPEKARFGYIGPSDLVSGLSGGIVRDIFQDSFGNTWMGTNRAVNFISHNQPFFSTITYSLIKSDTNGLSEKAASAVCYDNKNDLLWVGTEKGGIDVYRNREKIAHYNEKDNNLPENTLISALIDSDDNVWFGTNNRGLVKLNKKSNRFETFNLPVKRKYNSPFPINSLFEDDRRNLWAATYEGLFRYNLDTHDILYFSGDRLTLPNNLFRSVAQDADGNLWIGTLINGLLIISPQLNIIRRVYEINGISHIYRDSNGGMWVSCISGTYHFPYRGSYGEYEALNQENGLADEYVYAVTEGNRGEMWISTNTGISCYSVADRTIENYNHLNGVPYGPFMNASVTKADDGTIYFGSQNGVCYFDSKGTVTDYNLPPVMLTSFAVYDNKKIQSNNLIKLPASPRITLKYDQNNFMIDFSVMDYSLTNLVEYYYNLKGVDDLWYNIDGENRITFRNLSPGKYVFNVKARLKNQEWADDFASMQIEITPPFWLTWWAKLIYVVVALLIIYVLVKYYTDRRTRQKERDLNDEKLRFYTNVAHELKTPLTLILGPLADLKESKEINPEQISKISMIHKNASRLLDLTNQIMEFRKTETQNRKLMIDKNDISILVREVVIKYKELNQNKDVSIDVGIETGNTVIYYDPEVITIILDNIISNALKYTPKGTVEVYLRETEIRGKTWIEIEVRDTGVGMPENSLDKIFNRYYQVKGDNQTRGTGIGLALVKNLIQLHKASINVKSKLNEALRFTSILMQVILTLMLGTLILQ